MNKTNRTEFIRVEKTKNYTVIHNQFLRRSDLSWKAKCAQGKVMTQWHNVECSV